MREYMRRREGYYDKVTCATPTCRNSPAESGLCRSHLLPRRVITTPQVLACATCGVEFIETTQRRRVYCSFHCSRLQVQRQRRRQAKANGPSEKVIDRRVFERDKWVCRLCRRPIKQDLRYPHPGSASVDHIVPFSAGGTDTYRNTQAAHLRCNRRKQAKAWGHGEQLRAIG
jgi:hypothetical protein